MADHTNGNPWKGLNFYVEGEILYGRDSEILSLSQYIFNNTQTVLYGRSGIGKSSILNAGIFPRARLAGMTPVGIRLKHDDADSYIMQIRAAIVAAGLRPEAVLPAVEDGDNETLWEFMHRHHFLDNDGKRCVPLLVFDQFEEIFTLQADERRKRDFFRQLGDLLNDVKPAYIVEHENLGRQQSAGAQSGAGTKVVSSGSFKGMNLRLSLRRSETATGGPRYIERPDYHIVFSLREDFLSSLELYAATIPVMKDNRFGLLPINEEQAADIIRLPRPGLVDDDVTVMIIRQVTGRDDFILDGVPEIEVDSAVLSLYLSRLYNKMEPGETRITADLVNTYSGHIIHDFYVESVSSDPDAGEMISESSVLVLEDQLLTREGRRNNVSRSDLLASGVTAGELDILVGRRKLLRQFHHGNDIRVEFIHDILCPVVRERREQRELLRGQEQERRRQEQEKERIIREAEQRARAVRLRNRRALLWAASILAVVLLCGAYYWREKIYLPNKEHAGYYAQFELVNGWPVGVGELSEAQRRHTPLYYRLSHVGEGLHDTDVEICSSNSMLPADARVTNWPEVCKSDGDARGAKFNEVLGKVRRIHFVPGENGRVEKMELRGDRDSLMMLMSYFHLNDREAWIHYLNTTGQSMSIRDNGIDRVKLSWDTLGRIEYQKYYTSAGVAKPIHAAGGIGGFHRCYPDSLPGTVEYYTLDTYGLPVLDATYNIKRVTTRGDSVLTSYYKVATLDDRAPAEAVGDDGYSRIEYLKTGETTSTERLYIPGKDTPVALCKTVYDGYGNAVRQTIDGAPSGKFPPVIEWRYKGDTGLMAEKKYLEADGRPYGRKDGDICRWELEYDNGGNRISERRYSAAGAAMYSYDRSETKQGDNRIVKVVENDIIADSFLTVVDTVSERRVAQAYFGKGGQKINRMVPFLEEDSVLCHYHVEDKTDRTTTHRYYISGDNGEVAPIETFINPETMRATAFCLMETVDGHGNRLRMEMTDGNGRIVKRMMYFVQNGKPVGRAVWGLDDTPVRCPEWEEEGFGYYRLYFNKDFDDSFVNLHTYDEWMNSSLFQFSPTTYSVVSTVELSGMALWTAESGGTRIIIPGTKSVTVPRFIDEDEENVSDLAMPFMHVLSRDCILYKSGLRDGDRVVGIGAWRLGGGEDAFGKEWARLSKTPVDIDVLRPTASGLEKKEFHIPADSGAGVASECHFMKLSKDEKKYYESHVL